MSARRGFGDETWRLARAGDLAGLERAAKLLLTETGGLEYEGHRARAFRLAAEGSVVAALAELNEGWSEDWPSPAAYAVDVARIHFLTHDCAKALTALELDVRSAAHFDGLRDLVVECVRRDPRLWRMALEIVLAGEDGTAAKLGAAASVVGARLRGPRGSSGRSSQAGPPPRAARAPNESQ
jgi:hypothetical protein